MPCCIPLLAAWVASPCCIPRCFAASCPAVGCTVLACPKPLCDGGDATVLPFAFVLVYFMTQGYTVMNTAIIAKNISIRHCCSERDCVLVLGRYKPFCPFRHSYADSPIEFIRNGRPPHREPSHLSCLTTSHFIRAAVPSMLARSTASAAVSPLPEHSARSVPCFPHSQQDVGRRHARSFRTTGPPLLGVDR